MISFNKKTLCALVMLAASVVGANVAQAAAVQASAMITDRSGTLLNFSSLNEYDVFATTKQQDNTQFSTTLPDVFLNDSDGFSFASVDKFWDPMPSVSAGAHDLGLATSSVIWSFGYTATGSGTAVLDLSYSALVDALNVGAGETALGSTFINIKRSGVQEAGAEAFYYLTGGGHAGEDTHLLYSFNALAGDIGDFIVTVSTQAATSPVPVPAAVWLLGSGLMGLGALRRKRRLAVG